MQIVCRIFARNGVVIGGYYAATGFTADVSRREFRHRNLVGLATLLLLPVVHACMKRVKEARNALLIGKIQK